MERRPTYTAHNETMESIMGIFIDVLDRHRITLGNDEYLQLECDVMDALCGKYVKKDVTADLLGRTVWFGNHRWVVAHIEGDCAYLMLSEVLDRTIYGADVEYENSELLKAAAVFASSLPADALAQCQDVTVNGVTSKVFVPTFEQLYSMWDWPRQAASNRACLCNGSNVAWWTSTPQNSDRVWYISTNGYFYGADLNYSRGLRPAVKVKISAIELPQDSDEWDVVSERLNSIVPENMFCEIMRDTTFYSPTMEKVGTVRQKTGAGMVESYVAIMVCDMDVDLAVKMYTEHPDEFKKKANEIYAICKK